MSGGYLQLHVPSLTLRDILFLTYLLTDFRSYASYNLSAPKLPAGLALSSALRAIPDRAYLSGSR